MNMNICNHQSEWHRIQLLNHQEKNKISGVLFFFFSFLFLLLKWKQPIQTTYQESIQTDDFWFVFFSDLLPGFSFYL